MEEGDEALGFEREIYYLSERAEMGLDRTGHAITQPAHVDRLARTIAALEDIEREANAKARLVAANQAENIRQRPVRATQYYSLTFFKPFRRAWRDR